MKEIIDNIYYLYKTLLKVGINPIGIISVVLITNFLKTTIKYYNGKHKSLLTMITALVLGVGFAFLFCLLSGFTAWNYIVMNSLLNIMASSYSANIISAVKKFFESRLK